MPHPSHPTSPSHTHRSDAQEESDGSMHTDCYTTERRHTSLRHQLKLKCTVLDEMTPVYSLLPPSHTGTEQEETASGDADSDPTFQFGTDENL